MKEINKTEEELLNDKIIELKKQYKHIYQTDMAGETIIWRTLKRSEYKSLMQTIYSEDEDENFYARQDALTSLVILHPENKEEIMEDLAAVADIIATECMTKSGFDINNATKAL